MTDFFKMDVFFVVATIATVVVAIALVVALVYAIRFLRTLNRIGDDIEAETDAIREDIHDMRKKVRRFKLASLLTFFVRGASRKKRN